MAKKKKPKSNRDQQPEMGSFFDPRAMEQMMKDLSRLLSENEALNYVVDGIRS